MLAEREEGWCKDITEIDMFLMQIDREDVSISVKKKTVYLGCSTT